VFINTVDANTGYTADVAMDSFICQGANAGYTADAAMHSYICWNINHLMLHESVASHFSPTGYEPGSDFTLSIATLPFLFGTCAAATITVTVTIDLADIG
jgi:hypothetical protein